MRLLSIVVYSAASVTRARYEVTAFCTRELEDSSASAAVRECGNWNDLYDHCVVGNYADGGRDDNDDDDDNVDRSIKLLLINTWNLQIFRFSRRALFIWWSLGSLLSVKCKKRLKSKFLPIPSLKGPEGEFSYSSTLSLISALDGVGGGRRIPVPFTPEKENWNPLYRRLSGLRSGSGRVRKISPSTGVRSRTVQLVARRDTDYAVSTAVLELKYHNIRYNLLRSLLKKDGNSCRKFVRMNVSYIRAQGYSDITHSCATDMQYTHLLPTNLSGAVCW